MSEQAGKIDFCPKCGALTQNGVCQSCGYQLGTDAEQIRTEVETDHVTVDNAVEREQSGDTDDAMNRVESMEINHSMEQGQSADMDDFVNLEQKADASQEQNQEDAQIFGQGLYSQNTGGGQATTGQFGTPANQQSVAYSNFYDQQYGKNEYQRNLYQGSPYQNAQEYRNQQYGNNQGYQQNPIQGGQGYGSAPYQDSQGYQQAQNQSVQGYGSTSYQNNQGYQQAQNQSVQGYGSAPYQNNQGYQQAQNQNAQGYGSTSYQNNQGYQQAQNQNTQGYQYQQYQGNTYQGNRYIPEGGIQSQKKQNTGLIVALAIVGTILALTIFSIVLFAYFVFKSVDETASVDSTSDSSYDSEQYSEGENTQPPFQEEEKRGEDSFLPSESTGEDPFMAEGYVNRWGIGHGKPDPADFTGEYYENICESIDTSVDYKINRKYYEYFSDNGNTVIRVGYYQLEGDIPHLEELNNDILMYSAYMAGNYFDSYGDEGYDGVMELNTDSFVTYNDDKKMSIVLDEEWIIDDGFGFDLYAINIDLQNGVLVKNDEILDINEAFAKVFRERNTAQNEYDGAIPAVDDSTDKELAEYMNNSMQSIIFYTPMGMEVGFNYSYEGYSGWVTVTFKDYEKYLKSF